MADDGQIDDDRIRPVVAQRSHEREESGRDAAPDGKRSVGLVKLIRELVVAANEEVRQPEELELLRRDVAGADIAEVVELAPFRSPRVEQRIAEGCEVS